MVLWCLNCCLLYSSLCFQKGGSNFKFLMPKDFFFLFFQLINPVFLHSTSGLPMYEGTSRHDKEQNTVPPLHFYQDLWRNFVAVHPAGSSNLTSSQPGQWWVDAVIIIYNLQNCFTAGQRNTRRVVKTISKPAQMWEILHIWDVFKSGQNFLMMHSRPAAAIWFILLWKSTALQGNRVRICVPDSHKILGRGWGPEFPCVPE